MGLLLQPSCRMVLLHLGTLILLASVHCQPHKRQADGDDMPGEPENECCDQKMVGDDRYFNIGYDHNGMTMDLNCLSPCIFEKEDQPGSKYCFAAGDMKVECEDDMEFTPTGGPRPTEGEGEEGPNGGVTGGPDGGDNNGGVTGDGGGEDPSLGDVYANMDPVQFTGPSDWVIHDPSKIVATDGLLMIAVTGKAQEDGYTCGLETWYISPGESDWQPGQCLFTSKPDWVAEELPANDGAYWAPTLVDGRKMYYSVSAFENDDAQCIGMATATGVAPHLTWQDAGKPVTCSFDPESNGDTNAPNGIDPAFFQDQDGSQHLIFGGAGYG